MKNAWLGQKNMLFQANILKKGLCRPKAHGHVEAAWNCWKRWRQADGAGNGSLAVNQKPAELWTSK